MAFNKKRFVMAAAVCAVMMAVPALAAPGGQRKQGGRGGVRYEQPRRSGGAQGSGRMQMAKANSSMQKSDRNTPKVEKRNAEQVGKAREEGYREGLKDGRNKDGGKERPESKDKGGERPGPKGRGEERPGPERPAPGPEKDGPGVPRPGEAPRPEMHVTLPAPAPAPGPGVVVVESDRPTGLAGRIGNVIDDIADISKDLK